MPLLQSIIQELDREITRIESLRNIVASLSRTPAVVRRFAESTPTAAVLPVEARVPEPPRGRLKGVGQPRARKAKNPIQETRALASTVPSGPVVFNPAKLAEEQVRRKQGRGEHRTTDLIPVPEDLDSLARSMAVRWRTALVQ